MARPVPMCVLVLTLLGTIHGQAPTSEQGMPLLRNFLP